MNRKNFGQLHRTAIAAAVGLACSGHLHAAGFALSEINASGLGNAYAGGAASAEDASTVFSNPAGLTRLPGRQIVVSAAAVAPSFNFSNNNSTTLIGTAATGGNGGDAGSINYLPALYVSAEMTPTLRFGLGINVPFGLKTEYDAGWAGRYHALNSEISSININPSLAWKINDTVSVGGGINVMQLTAELSKAVDFGSICFARIGPAVCNGAGVRPQTRDGFAKVDGSDWGYGFNLGAMFNLGSATRIGVAYRSKVKEELTGSASFRNPTLPGGLAALTAPFTGTSTKVSVELPESASWAVMADVTWTAWNRIEELRVRFGNGLADSVTPEHWHSTIRVSAGATWQLSDPWKLRIGAAYDESPVSDEFRTPRLPDSDRTWIAFGASYRFSPQGSIDVGYSHLFVRGSSINTNDPTAGTIRGNYSNKVDILAAQLTYNF